jgi:hypothetical protein
MNADTEIAFLEKLYLLPSEGEEDEMKENLDVNQLAAAVLADAQVAATRVGTDGHFCYFCGYDVPTSACRCPHPENFRCAGKRVCADCEKAMISIANHIAGILRAKRVNRVSSIRLRMFHQLGRAAREIGNEDVCAPSELSFCLAQADEDHEDDEVFRAQILRAFGRCRFLRFRALADTLEQEASESLIRAIIRSGIVGHTG